MESSLAPYFPISDTEQAACMGMWHYDRLRLGVYLRDRPGLAIRMREAGRGLALRFDDVGYFNRAVWPAENLAESVGDLMEFYGDGKVAFRLSVMRGSEGGVAALDGFVAGEVEDYLVTGVLGDGVLPVGEWSFDALDAGDGREFFGMYLKLFAGPGCRVEDALNNMEKLVGVEGLHCYWAVYRGDRVGLGMWHRQGRLACFCAGGILPDFRGMGGHSALVEFRLGEALRAGCDRAVAVAKAGSDSGRNLRRAGFRLVWRDAALCWPGSQGSNDGPGGETERVGF